VVVPVVVVVVVVMVMAMTVAAVGDGLGGGEDEAAGLDPLGADQAVGQLTHQPRRAAQEDHLQATAGVEVDVGGGHDAVEVVVL
jgi:hypothetical protein